MNYYRYISNFSKYTLGFGFVFLTLFSSCKEDEIKMTPKIKMHIDTTYRNEVRVLAGELDSICDMRFDSLVSVAKDSILKLRLEERKEKLGQ